MSETEAESFLEQLSHSARQALKQMNVTQSFAAGEMIITQDDLSDSAYVVLKGLAQATIFSAEGKMVAFRDVGMGEIFGELAAIDGQPRSACILAVSDVMVGILTREQVAQLITTEPDFAWALLRHLAVQSRAMTERIFEFSTMLVRERLAHELLRLADASNTRQGLAVIAPAPTHYDLAVRISTHREAVSREMSRWSKMGLVVRDGPRLSLCDIAKLREVEGIFDRGLDSMA